MATEASVVTLYYESDGMPLVISLVALIALILSVTLCVMIIIRFLRLRRHDITRGYDNMSNEPKGTSINTDAEDVAEIEATTEYTVEMENPESDDNTSIRSEETKTMSCSDIDLTLVTALAKKEIKKRKDDESKNSNVSVSNDCPEIRIKITTADIDAIQEINIP